MKNAVLTFALIFVCSPAFAEETTKVWQGTWRNLKFRTTGTLKCTAVTKDGKNWDGTFEGVFQGRKFRYKAKFVGKPGRGRTDLSGKATIDGAKYQWTGYIRGTALSGKFRASNGYFGNFGLKEVKTKSRQRRDHSL
jgi:hypothetical protein